MSERKWVAEDEVGGIGQRWVDIETTSPVRRELNEDFVRRIGNEGIKSFPQRDPDGPFDNRRLVVIARNLREADDYLRVMRVHRKDATVICGDANIGNLMSLNPCRIRVVTIGYWQDGFTAGGWHEVNAILGARKIEVTHVQDWR